MTGVLPVSSSLHHVGGQYSKSVMVSVSGQLRGSGYSRDQTVESRRETVSGVARQKGTQQDWQIAFTWKSWRLDSPSLVR